MKKIFLFLFASVLFIGCSNEEFFSQESTKSTETEQKIQKRSIEEVIEIANQLVAARQSASATSRSGGVRYGISTQPIVVKLTSSRSNSDTLIYAVNFTNNAGFALISANKATPSIIGIIDEGNYEVSEAADNKNFTYFLNSAAEYVASARTPSVPPVKPTNPFDDDLIMTKYVDTIRSIETVDPRVNVKWNQYWPENKYCPNKVAGCAPIAVAQLFSYFKPTMNLDITFEGKPYDNLNVDWNSINKHIHSFTDTISAKFLREDHISKCSADASAHDALAVLIRQIGEEAHATYKPVLYSSTPCRLDSCLYLAKKYLNRRYTFSEPIYFFSDLKERGVGLVYGEATNYYNIGHLWIADAVGTILYTLNTYYNYHPFTGEYDRMTSIQETEYYIHYNWGWGGLHNGYFLQDVFQVDKGVDLSIFSRANYNLNGDVRAYIYY